MTEVGVRVDGLRNLRRDLKQVAGNADDLKEANARAAAIVATAASARAPRKTGRLAASVRGNRAVSKAQVKAGGAAVPYAGPIHWGWPSRDIDPQPFIAEAAQDTESIWLPAYEQDLARALDRVRGNTY